MRYFIYCRKSSEAEDRQVLSLESQLSALRQTFGQNSAIEIVDTCEEAYSAKAPGRPIFNRMLARIEAGEADGIVAWAPDRLARNSVDGGRIVYLLDCGKLHDLKFATYTFENNSQGKFMLQIMFGQSKYYSDALSENVKRGNRTKLEKGWRPNQAPIGYANDARTRTIVKDPDRFQLIRRMFDLALTGSYTVRQICDIARVRWGLTTPVRKRTGGQPLALCSVYRVLTNPFYAGLILWRGKLYQGAHEPIVSMAEFERVRAMLRRREKPKPHTRHFAYTGIVRCGECGSLVTAEHKVNLYGSEYTYYHCTKRRPDYRCRQRSLRVEQLEHQIENFLARLRIPETLQKWILDRHKEGAAERRSTEEARRRSLEKSLSDIDRASSNLTSLRTRDLIGDEEFVSERQALEKERIGLKQSLQNVTEQSTFELFQGVISFCNRATDWFRAGDDNCRRLILESAGSNFVLKDKKLRIEARKPLTLGVENADFLRLRGVVDDIRTLSASKDPQFMTLVTNIRELETRFGIRPAAEEKSKRERSHRQAASGRGAHRASGGDGPSHWLPPA